MNKKLAVFGTVFVIGLGAVLAINLTKPQVSGDFPGGIVPTQLWTASTSTASVSPIGGLPNLLLGGTLSVGGTAAANQVTALYTATTSYPAATVNLGPVTASTSTTSTAVSFTASGLSVGDSCQVSYNGATTTSSFGADAFVTAASGNAATATATFWNGSNAAITLTPTSSATGVSSTLKVTCFHTGV